LKALEGKVFSSTPKVIIGGHSNLLKRRIMTSREFRFLGPAVKDRITRFIDEVRDDIEQGQGLKTVYNVRSTGDLLNVLSAFERTGQFNDDQHGELINDYLIFIRSGNIVDDNPV